MKTLYAVPWIEIEYGWGERPEGFKIFDDLEECINSTKESFDNGNYEGGYIGPKKPLGYYLTPDEIEGPFPKFIKKLKFKSIFIPIIKIKFDSKLTIVK